MKCFNSLFVIVVVVVVVIVIVIVTDDKKRIKITELQNYFQLNLLEFSIYLYVFQTMDINLKHKQFFWKTILKDLKVQ